ncbi:MAG TPA: carbon monoxide dehydrogenase subunit G [Vicinamibacterales bacterium]
MIEIARTYTFEAPPDRVWQLLMDTKALSSCIPGCESLDPDPETENRYVIRLNVKLAAVMGTYNGSVQLLDLMPMQSYALLAEGRGRPGFVKGKAAIGLAADGNATTLTVTGDVHTGGAIARVGQRIIKSAARLMMDRFFKRLKAIAEGRAERGAELDAAEDALDEGADES